MSVEALKQYTLRAKYARYNRQEKRRETYAEATNRVRNMMLGLYPQVTEEINQAYDSALAEKVLGSQRALQFGGKPALQHNARVFNCCASFCDRLRFFQEALYLLLCGCGTGFSVQKHHIAKLPAFSRLGGPFHPGEKTFVIPDTIEGWSDALGVLLSSYFTNGVFPEYEGYYVNFDYSLIRPEGSYLSSGAGKAPGPDPLRRALEKIRALLDRCVASGSEKLRPIDAYDIVMHASDAVLAGGVRRSATICIFSLDDVEMMTAKTGNWFVENPQRGRSNNSVLLLKGQTTYEQFREVLEHVKEWGEPGFYWSDSTEQLPNPCQPAWAKVLTPDGIRTLGEIDAGDMIWGPLGWTKVVKKWSTGINPVFRYETTAGVFYGTQGHQVVSYGKKIKAVDAESVDTLTGPYVSNLLFDTQAVVDGLVTGDGTVHEASNRKVLLLVGSRDKDYFDADVAKLIKEKHSAGPYTYDVSTTITADELPLTFMRRVPARFIRGNRTLVCSFLRGLFSANGSICGQRVTLKSASKGLIEDVQTMLSSIGIRSYYTTNDAKVVNFENGPYLCRESYDLNISTDRVKFQESIGFIQRDKQQRLKDIVALMKRDGLAKTTYDIISITQVSEEETFDITVDNSSHTYWSQCMHVSNCVEIGFWPRLMLENTAESTHELLTHYQGPIDYAAEDSAFSGELIGNNTLIVSGWQFCNLSTINGGTCDTPQAFYNNCEDAAIIGTCQAGMTKLPYLGPVTELIVTREALLGVSITAVMDNPHVLLDPEVLREGARIVVATNERIAQKIGINPCARATCMKPEGTGTLMLGSLACGLRPWHAKKVLRRVQANRNEPVAKFFREKNPWAVEKSVWCQNGTTDVLTFCVDAPPGAIIQDDVDAIQFLKYVETVVDNWIRPGKRQERCTQPWLTHNVSNTVTVRPEEWEDVGRYIYDHRENFAGVSLLAYSGDKDYPQAPFTAVYNHDEIEETYGKEVVDAAKPLLKSALNTFDNDVWKACEHLLTGDVNGDFERNTLLTVCHAFADTYLNGDVRRLTYILKDLDNLNRWEFLRKAYQPVNYDELIEEEDSTVPMAEVACAGGACSL